MVKKKKHDSKKNVKNLMIVLISIFAVMIALNIYIIAIKPLMEVSVPANVVFGETIGISAANESLDFGVLPLGVSSTKKVVIENTYNFPIHVIVYVNGEIRNYVYGENHFSVEAGESYEYMVNIAVPSDGEFGKYSGNIVFVFQK